MSVSWVLVHENKGKKECQGEILLLNLFDLSDGKEIYLFVVWVQFNSYKNRLLSNQLWLIYTNKADYICTAFGFWPYSITFAEG